MRELLEGQTLILNSHHASQHFLTKMKQAREDSQFIDVVLLVRNDMEVIKAKKPNIFLQ